jgi:long-chain acyl-CoA synthetase
MVGSVIAALGARAARGAGRTALLWGGERVSYGELWERSGAAAAHLAARGVRPGERVLLAAPGTPAFVYAYLGAQRLGAVAAVLDPQAPAARRDDIVRRIQPALILDAEALGALALAAAATHDFPLPAPEALAELVFTTGTTGQAKGVRLTHGNVSAAAAHINAVIGTAEDDVEVVPLPLYHSSGLARLRCALSAGAAIALVPGSRLPGEILGALERHAATALCGVPAGFALLLRFGDQGLGRFAGQLRYVEIGSAPMPLEHKRELMRLLPRTRLYMNYGLTEASRSAFIEFHRDAAHLESVGRPAPGVQAEVREGVLWVRGAHVAPGYWDSPELTAGAFTGGWMRTGDLAQVDAEGWIYLRGREDDLVNVGGFKVAPEEVERVLALHAAVAEAACVGTADARGITGQQLSAFLVAAPGAARPADAELARWALERLEAYKVPARYAWVDELPRTDSGKLRRGALRGTVAAA